MWSGAIVVLAAAQALGAGDGEHVGADALDVGAHLHEHAREVLDVRLAGGVADDASCPGVSAAASSAFSVRHDRRLVHEDVAGAQAAAARCSTMSRVAARRRRRARGTRRGAGPGGGGRSRRRRAAACRRGRSARAAGRRAGTRRGCARRARGRPRLGGRRRRRTARPRARRATRPRRRGARAASSIASTSRMRGTLRTTTSSSVRSAGGEDGQRAVLVAGRHDRAGQRHAAFDDELLHGCEAPAAASGRAAGAGLG